jgi:hypothetical protein
MNHDTPTQMQALDQINNGKVKMHSRGRLIVQTGSQILATTTLLLLTIYLLSYVLFQAKSSGAIHLTAFGTDGVLDLLLSLPKIIIILTTLLFILFIWAYEHYPLAYRRPLLISILGVTIIVVTASGLVYKSGLHDFLYAMDSNSPLVFSFKQLYHGPLQGQLHNSTIGQVKDLQPDFFTILSTDGQTYLIHTPTLRSGPAQPLDLNDWIIVKGDINDREVKALNIKLVPSFK